jgi:hypothetical protein
LWNVWGESKEQEELWYEVVTSNFRMWKQLQEEEEEEEEEKKKMQDTRSAPTKIPKVSTCLTLIYSLFDASFNFEGIANNVCFHTFSCKR